MPRPRSFWCRPGGMSQRWRVLILFLGLRFSLGLLRVAEATSTIKRLGYSGIVRRESFPLSLTVDEDMSENGYPSGIFSRFEYKVNPNNVYDNILLKFPEPIPLETDAETVGFRIHTAIFCLLKGSEDTYRQAGSGDEDGKKGSDGEIIVEADIDTIHNCLESRVAVIMLKFSPLEYNGDMDAGPVLGTYITPQFHIRGNSADEEPENEQQEDEQPESSSSSEYSSSTSTTESESSTSTEIAESFTTTSSEELEPTPEFESETESVSDAPDPFEPTSIPERENQETEEGQKTEENQKSGAISLSRGAVIGIGVGGGFLILLVITFTISFCRRRSARNRNSSFDSDVDGGDFPVYSESESGDSSRSEKAVNTSLLSPPPVPASFANNSPGTSTTMEGIEVKGKYCYVELGADGTQNGQFDEIEEEGEERHGTGTNLGGGYAFMYPAADRVG